MRALDIHACMNENCIDHPSSESSDEPPDSSGGDEHQQKLTFTVDDSDIAPTDVKWFKCQFARIINTINIPQISLSVVLLGDDRMTELHEQFTGIDGTTDVLSFDMIDRNTAKRDTDKHCVNGEIYVCVDEARRQAIEREHDIRHELLLYLTHGLLHLLGYDDHDPGKHRVMHRKEDELLTAIGVGPVFHT